MVNYGPLRLARQYSSPCLRAVTARSPKNEANLMIPSSVRSRLHYSVQANRYSTSPLPASLSQKSNDNGTRSTRSNRWTKLIGTVSVLSLIYAWDQTRNAEAITRTLRTAYNGVVMAVDFKLSFSPEKSEQIDALHQRIANRINHLCNTNGGLYIKLGQALGAQAAVLPKPYREAFANMYDNAPAVDWDAVVKVFQGEFGVHPLDAFETFERKPVASASIAQVHKARLKRPPGQAPWRDGEGWVAVKIRKPSVPIQVEWDLFSYRALLWTYEKLFDLPISFVSKYVTLQMRKEVNLKTEAENATRAGKNIANDASLRDRITVPKVYWEWTGESVMTAEFVNAAVKLTDKTGLERLGLGNQIRTIMDAANAVFAAQTFKHGFVHCDPHPGNILVRQHPQHPGKPQIVLIDHGLYIELGEEFRQQYCLLWRSLFVGDTAAIENIVEKWGIAKQNSDMFASMTLLRPHHLRRKPTVAEKTEQKSTYDSQVGLKDRLRSMLESEELIPRELIFISRSMRMMQASNQSLGSPSNRINTMAHYAAAGLELTVPVTSQTINALGLRAFAVEKARLLLFRVVLFAIDIGFALTQARRWVLANVFGRKADGFEDILQRQVQELASDYGVELDDEAFAG